MLCPHCGTYTDNEAIVCASCGRLLPRGEVQDAGVMSIRQGRRARADRAAGRTVPLVPTGGASANEGNALWAGVPEAPLGDGVKLYTDSEVYDEYGLPMAGPIDRPNRTSRGTRVEPVVSEEKPRFRRSQRSVFSRQINWMLVLVIGIAAAIVLAVGTLVFLTRTASGQRIMARMGMSASSTALWEVGTERLNVGDIDGAIDYFCQAIELDGEDNVNVPGMLLLGSAYEAASLLDDAEALYTHIYTDIVPSAPDAYTNLIRILLAEERNPEAAELMKLAYQKTGVATFNNQRNQLLPQPPTCSPVAGFYEEVKNVSLISADEYPIYYTFDPNAKLPEDGILYTGSLRLDENTWPLRAVCVNGDLISDEFSATFRISMPSPTSPYASLAPMTYKQRQKLRIYQNIERDNDPNITIYYTIDGSTPDADSPIYTGEPFWLPGGRVTLKAVSVNQYGKASNMLEVLYKIETGPYPLTAYTVDDTANGLRLNGTLYSDFVATYGEPTATEEITRQGFDGIVRKCTYSWGYAVFHSHKGNQLLIELYFTTTQLKAPRSTGIGDTVDKVIGKYRDMGQVASPSGNRGLYSNESGTGKLYLNGNGTNRADESQIIYAAFPVDAQIIRYSTDTADSHIWQLDYICESNRVTAVCMKYIP